MNANESESLNGRILGKVNKQDFKKTYSLCWGREFCFIFWFVYLFSLINTLTKEPSVFSNGSLYPTPCPPCTPVYHLPTLLLPRFGRPGASKHSKVFTEIVMTVNSSMVVTTARTQA